MNNEGPTTANGGGAVDAALAEYLLRRERGESVDLTALIAAYPGCDVEVRKFIAQERDIHRVMVADAPAKVPAQDLAGRTLGDFRLLRIIGRGGMGIVWEAEQVSLRRKVAVKLLPGALCADPRHRTRFQNEARILAQLEHPNIVNVIAVGEEADTYFFAMQHVDGMTVDDWIRMWAEGEPCRRTVRREGDRHILLRGLRKMSQSPGIGASGIGCVRASPTTLPPHWRTRMPVACCTAM